MLQPAIPNAFLVCVLDRSIDDITAVVRRRERPTIRNL
jgi:hypothetical protein